MNPVTEINVAESFELRIKRAVGEALRELGLAERHDDETRTQVFEGDIEPELPTRVYRRDDDIVEARLRVLSEARRQHNLGPHDWAAVGDLNRLIRCLDEAITAISWGITPPSP